ncbi:hypothetical protein WJX82_003937 [Trebouxia sp. C0006]
MIPADEPRRARAVCLLCQRITVLRSLHEAEWLQLQDHLQPWCKSTTPPIDHCSAMTPSFKVTFILK